MAWPGQSRAARGPSGAEPRRAGGRAGGSLREARPPRGPAGGGEVAGPGGAGRAGAAEAADARRRAGRGVGAPLPRWPPSWVLGVVVLQLPRRRLSRRGTPPLSPLRTCARPSVARSRVPGPERVPGRAGSPGELPDSGSLGSTSFQELPSFPPRRCRVSVKPKVPGRGAVIRGASELPGLTS